MKSWAQLTRSTDLEFERLLLDSASYDASPPAARTRVAAGLGIDLERVGELSKPAEPARADEFEAVAHGGVKASALDVLLKYTLVGIMGGFAAIGTSSRGTSDGASAALEAPVIERVEAATGRAEVGLFPPLALGLAAANTEPKAAPPRVARMGSGRATRSPVVAAPRGQVEPDLASETRDASGALLLAEVKQLDRVRGALDSAKVQAALSELDAYDARFPSGVLALEAVVLRVRALTRAGQFAVAARTARHALTLSGSERYHSELVRLVAAEGMKMDKVRRAQTLEAPR